MNSFISLFGSLWVIMLLLTDLGGHGWLCTFLDTSFSFSTFHRGTRVRNLIHSVSYSLKKQEQGDSSCILSQSDIVQGTYSSGFWPSLILTAQRKGLATSMNCSGFDKGGSAKRPQKNCCQHFRIHFAVVLFRSEIN